MTKWRSRLGLAAVAGGLALALGGAALAEDSERVKSMKTMGGHMGAIGKVAKGEAEYSAETVKHAEAIQAHSKELVKWFPEGSGGETTRAKPEVWTDWAGFEKAAMNFQDTAPKLVEAAKTGDKAQIGAALGAVGKTCGGCHDSYRKPKT
jgi:cytochrome c556